MMEQTDDTDHCGDVYAGPPPLAVNIEMPPTDSLGSRRGIDVPHGGADPRPPSGPARGGDDVDGETEDAVVLDRPYDEVTPEGGDRDGRAVTKGLETQPHQRTGVVRLSDRILREVRDHHVRAGRERRCSLRRTFAVLLGVVPVGLFALEMVPERCHLCLDHVELDTYFVVVALCGGVGATLYSAEFWNYSAARFLGGAVAALGSLFTVWMILQSGGLALPFVVVGVLGAMPGVAVYFLVKILSDECCSGRNDDDGYDDEFRALTGVADTV